MVNSAAARALELDDVHERALMHAPATVLPLALAEQRGSVSDERLLWAVMVANDVACRLSLAVDTERGGDDHHPRVMSLT